MLEIGSLVDGKYKILRVVGKGGMSVVYQAVNEKANKIWAIKEVRKDGVQNFEVVKQNLIVETELLKRFNHPNLPSIIDVIDGDGSFLIVMDYIEGNSLNKALENGAQSQDDVVEWSKQLCDVLGYLHSRKPPIIYRDMKPANVMLKPDGNVSLIDFGTAREFKSSSVEDTTCLGTQGYAAPEQYGGHGQTDARTDIYCLGATMYHLITGHNPSTPPYEMYPIRQWNPNLSSGLEEIIIKCTQRNPADRYQSCAELLYALDHYKDLDIENKKVQNFKWKTFFASSILALITLIATVGFSIASSVMTSSTYESLLLKGENNNDAQQYIEAIEVKPDNIEAYVSLLNLYMTNNILSKDEYNTLQKIETEYEEELIEADAVAFAEEFAIELADDLFFCYKLDDRSVEDSSSEGIVFSKKWYKKVAENSGNDKIIEKAQLLSKFAENINNRTSVDVKGNYAISPEEYWDTLKIMSDGELVDKENIVVALKCYNFVSKDLYYKNSYFMKKGIPKEEYMSLVDKIRSNIDSIINSDEYKDNEIQLKAYIKSINDYLDRISEVNYGDINDESGSAGDNS